MWREHHSGNVINASVALVTRKRRSSYQHAARLRCGGHGWRMYRPWMTWRSLAVEKTERVRTLNWIVSNKGVKIPALYLSNWISIQPPLQIWGIKSIAEIIQTAVAHDLFAGEPIDVIAREDPAQRNRVAERIVAIAGGHSLAGVEHVSDVAIP